MHSAANNMRTQGGDFPFKKLLTGGYCLADLRGDLLAGATVGIVAVPLAMALAIASGVPPQHGLYTSIIAGTVIAVFGGAQLSISGPTAAFVVILLPITQKFGLGGLLLTTVMAGCILIGMGLARMGRLIQFIPYPVTTGFTAGIAVVIASLQVKDFLGLDVSGAAPHFLDKAGQIFRALPTLRGADCLIGTVTLAVLLFWRRLKSNIPAHLVALLAGSLAALLCRNLFSGFDVATIGSRFSFEINGVIGHGIPPLPPMPLIPWELPDAGGHHPIGISLQLVRQLMAPALTIAMLGAIESLLCAVVADGMAGTKHNPNAELIGQGLGNIITPFFGGITATAAIARTAVNIRSGGRTPLAALFHALTVLGAVVALAGLLAYIPMASLAALLIIVAWDMSEAKRFMHIVTAAPRSDVAVLLTCFGLTVIFDMVLAVGVGVVLASFLFIRRMTELTGVVLATPLDHEQLENLPPHIAVYEIKGPLFFGAAEKAVGLIQRYNSQVEAIIIDMTNVSALDMTGIVALESLVRKLNQANVAVVISGLSTHIHRKLFRAGLQRKPGKLAFASRLDRALNRALKMRPGATPVLKNN